MRLDAAGPSLFWRVGGSSVIVLQIEAPDFVLSDLKSHPPIATDRNAPCSGAVASELVNTPAGRTNDAAHVGCRDQHREDVAQSLHKVIAEFPAVVLFDEAQEAPVPDASNDHAHKIVRLHRTLVNCLAPKTGSRRRGALASREVAYRAQTGSAASRICASIR